MRREGRHRRGAVSRLAGHLSLPAALDRPVAFAASVPSCAATARERSGTVREPAARGCFDALVRRLTPSQIVAAVRIGALSCQCRMPSLEDKEKI